ncbi:MAG: peptide-methionine (S)-S-oxide reductase [Cellvibrionaceae bacterium]|jgi:peptide-methionine (S)-S-oxide reductase
MKKIFCLLATLWLMQVSNSFAQNTIKEGVLIVAGGCFWCTESDFEKHKGVLHAESGYINGSTLNPTYKEVSSNQTGHFEAVKITYNKDLVTLRDLVDFYWYTIDPTDPNGQFCDKGSSYKTALFYQDEAQKAVFEDSLASIKLTKPFDESIVTEILKAKKFYSAEAYHQDFYKKSSLRYKYYRHSCGREKRIEQLWGQIVTDKL